MNNENIKIIGKGQYYFLLFLYFKSNIFYFFWLGKIYILLTLENLYIYSLMAPTALIAHIKILINVK